jgi:hypothetical protein
MCDALDNMQRAVADSYVSAGPLEVDGHAYKLKAWGVWIHRARPDAQGEPQGQNGVLGTSAGLELMSSTRDFRDDITQGERQSLIVGAWLYLHDKLAESQPEAGPNPHAKPAADTPRDPRGTLVIRQGQVLRALSALEHHLTAVLQRSGDASPLAQNRELAVQVLGEMRKCRVDEIPVADYPALRVISENSEVVAGYSYLSGQDGSPDDPKTLPETPIEWAYLLASVLVGLSRAYLAYFLTLAEFPEYITKNDVTRLARWVQTAMNSDNPDELRVGLYAGWSILQMDLLFESDTKRVLGSLHTGSTGGVVDSSAHQTDLAFTVKQRRTLTAALLKGAEKVIESPSLQTDLHHPYSFHISVPGAGKDPYRQDHLVVPTVPIALWLVARLNSHALFDPRVEHLAREVAACFEDPHSPHVAPGQSSTYNGTVNMNYLHEATAELHDLAQRTAARSFLWRLRAGVRRPRPTWDNLTSSPKVALGFALFLVLLVGPMIAWLWGFAGVVPGGTDDPRTVRTTVSTNQSPLSTTINLPPAGTVTIGVSPPRSTNSKSGRAPHAGR